MARSSAQPQGTFAPTGAGREPTPRMPAEWEPHRATWLAWPHNRSDWPGRFEPIPWLFAELVRLLAEVERVRIVVRDVAQRADAAARLAAVHARVERVDFVEARTNRSWTRDFLPSMAASGAGRRRRLHAVKWRFNGWARYSDHRADERAGAAVARWLAARGAVVQEPRTPAGRRVVLEGGAIDVDGEGTLLTTARCLVEGAHARGAELGREGYERIFREHLGVSRVIWLEDGIAGDDTSGHVDDFARFVRPGVVVVAAERDRRDENHAPLARARRALARARDARGRALEVVPLPMPAPVWFRGQRLPASYANFYLCNHRLLVPTFGDPCDARALSILAELCPEREVVGVPCRDLVLGLGTLHCSTQQEPEASQPAE